MKRIKSPEYSMLARIYDSLMDDVDYESWADFLDEIIQTHHPAPHSILELACGTGTIALSLDELMCYNILATDISEEMIRIARQKAERRSTTSVSFQAMNFLDIDLDGTFDVVISTFDSINYLHDPDEILQLFEQVKKVLGPESLFVFDFTTPKNSIKAIQYLNNEEGYTDDNYRFFRKSRYDADEQVHYNTFDIEKLAADQETVLKKYHEVHEQKIYSLQEMLDIIGKTDYTLLAQYDGFDMVDADESSLRITMVLRCRKIQ